MALDRADVVRAVVEQMEDWFDPQVLARAGAYSREGSVLDVEEHAAGLLTARVQGSEREPYDVEIQISATGEILATGCSCPYGASCKHAAAALLVWTRRAAPLEAAPKGVPAGVGRAAAAWLRQVETLAREGTPAVAAMPPVEAAPSQTELRYSLTPTPGGAQVAAVKRRMRKDGSAATEEAWNNFHNAARNPPGFARDEDLAVFATVARFVPGAGTYYAGQAAPLLAGRGADHALRALLASGRLHWNGWAGPLLVAGPPKSLRLQWEQRADHWRLMVWCDGAVLAEAAQLLVAETTWVVLVTGAGESAQLCPAKSALAPGWLRIFAAAPVLDAAAAARLCLLVPPGVPTPDLAVEVVDGHPVPVLRLHGDNPVQDRRRRQDAHHGAQLEFRYGERWLSAGSDADDHFPVPGDEGVQRFLRRNRAMEQAAVGRLPSLGLAPVRPAFTWNARPGAPGWHWPQQQGALQFLVHGRRAVERDGWDVQIEPSWPMRPLKPDDWEGKVAASSTDWLELSLSVRIGRERLDLVELLVAALRRDGGAAARQAIPAEGDMPPPLLCPAGERLVSVPFERVRSLLALLLELLDAGELPTAGKLELSRFDLARLARLEGELPLSFTAGSRPLLALARRLRGFSGITTGRAPAALQAQLRGYQLQGLGWMQFLRQYGLAGVLADEMGLGKTVQTLAHVLVEKAAGRLNQPALVVAPTSVLPNWEREAARFAPGLRVLTVHGKDRAGSFADIARHDLLLTSYPLLARDARHWLAQRFHLVVLDEAQSIKNAKTQAAQTACALAATHRLALTGTPLENHLGELWSLFRFLMPGFLGEEKRFDRVYRRPIEKEADAGRRAELVARLAPFILRRTKEAVARDLPPCTDTVVPVRMEGRQAEVYETVRALVDEKLRAAIAARGLARSQIEFLAALLKLRQVCCDPRLLPAARKSAGALQTTGSAKLDALMDLLDECRDNGRRVLVFSQFTTMLDLIEPRLTTAGLSFVRLDGATRDRRTPVDRFQAGQADVFLISLKAGGTGLNLTAADTVIHYDPWWNPAVQAQATARAHRIGQDKPVFVYRLICAGSVEEKILTLQERKAELASAILEGSAAGIDAIGVQELQWLFAPL